MDDGTRWTGVVLVAITLVMVGSPLGGCQGCDEQPDDDSATNSPPVLDVPASVSIAEGCVSLVEIGSSDADGDAVVFDVTGVPPYATFTDLGDGSGVLDLRPSFEDQGSTSLTVTVSDGESSDTADLLIEVIQVPLVTIVVGSHGGAGFADGMGTQALFFQPYGITQFGGQMYIGGGQGETVRTFDPGSSMVGTLAGIPNELGLVDSADGPAQFHFPAGLSMGPDGLLYVADRWNGLIRVVDPTSGEVSTLRSNAGVVLATEPFDVIFDGMTLLFSDIGECAIFGVDLSTGEAAVVAGIPGQCDIVDGGVGVARMGEPRGMVLHPDGILYYADRSGECIRAIDLVTGDISTVYGSGAGREKGFVDAVGLDARFGDPTGVTLDGDVMYVADSDNDAIRRIDLVTDEVTTIAGIGVNGNADGPGDEASFSWPVDVELGPDGDLYVIDPGGHCVRRIDLDDPDYLVTTVAGTVDNSGAIDGVGDVARMTEPMGMAGGVGDVVWVMDSFNLQIRSLDLATNELRAVAGSAEQWGHQDGVGTDVLFMSIQAGAWAGDLLYITETPGHNIRTLDPETGEVATVAGEVNLSGSDDGVGADARFSRPTGITVAEDGLLYVVDSGNRAIRVLDPTTNEVDTLLAGGSPQNPLASGFGIVADGAGTLYVTDTASCTLVAVDMDDGGASIVAGRPGECAVVDGRGLDARLRQPYGIDRDPATGTMYIADRMGHVIRTFDPATGDVGTLAGDPQYMAPVDGPLMTALFSTPVGVLVHERGLLVVDQYSAHIRRIELE